jgi:hypothetical protein
MEAAVQPRRKNTLLSVRSWRATVDEDGHYSFAVALRCRGLLRDPIRKSATACDLALRLMGGVFPISQDCPVTLR